MKRLIFLFSVVFLTSEGSGQSLRFFEFGMRLPAPLPPVMIAATSVDSVIAKLDAQLDLPENERNLFIAGQIQYGNEGNSSYTWHFVPNAWDMVERAIELCDGRPDDVENDKQYWIETVGVFCPWSSYVIRQLIPHEVDDREDAKIHISPNPTSDIVTIESSIEPIELMVLDGSGKVLPGFSSKSRIIDLTSQPSGVYYFVIKTNEGHYVYKTIKQ